MAKDLGMIQETIHAKCEVDIPLELGEVEVMQGLGLFGNGSRSCSLRGRRLLKRKTQKEGR